MLSSSLAFLAGICLLLCCERLPGAIVWAAAAAALPPAWYWRRRVTRVPALLIAGFCWAGWHAAVVLAVQLPSALEGRDLVVTGQVDGVPEQLDHQRLRLRFHIRRWHDGDVWRKLDLPVRLTWYRHAADLRDGERWQLRVRLKRPHGLANPGGFDYERWLFAQGLRATGYVRTGPDNRRLAAATGMPWTVLRRRITAHLQRLDAPIEQRALMRALAVGDRAGMSDRQWQVLQHTGTSHLLAISGLHVGLVASLVFLLTRHLWRWLGGARVWPAARAAALAAMLAALAYALLSGFQVPAQRATIMIWLWMGAILAGGVARPGTVLGQALWIILLHTPLAVLTAGFWLSFGAVGLILFLSLGRHGRQGRTRRLLRVQLSLVAGLTPLLWLWFGQAPLLGSLANLVAIPWVGFMVVPPLFLALLLLPLSTALADALLSLTGISLQALWQVLQGFDFGSAALVPAPPVGGVGLALFAAGLLFLLLPGVTGLRLPGAALLLPALTLPASRPLPGDVRATLLDVGQGLAVAVETHTYLLVYDTGPAYPGGFDSGARVLVPFLHTRGHRRVDRLVISHSDNDHSGGGASLYHALSVGRVDAGEPGAIAWAEAADCRRQPPWRRDGVTFAYLVADIDARGNNASCVLKVTAADGRSLLLPGDIEEPAEQALLTAHAGQLHAQVLVAPHHGSGTSSSAGFVAAVRPDWVLFATGYRNRFGFPRPPVVARYRAAGVRRADTAVDGAVSVRIEAGRAIRVRGWRGQHPRLWRPGS